MAQFGRPSVDTYNGDSYVNQAGSGSNLFQSIDEAAADDTDYIKSPNNPTQKAYVTKLTSLIDPTLSTNHVIRVRAKKDLTNTNTLNLAVELREGYVNEGSKGTLIATLTQSNVTTAFVTYSYTLSGAEANAITDYTNLYLRIVANP